MPLLDVGNSKELWQRNSLVWRTSINKPNKVNSLCEMSQAETELLCFVSTGAYDTTRPAFLRTALKVMLYLIRTTKISLVLFGYFFSHTHNIYCNKSKSLFGETTKRDTANNSCFNGCCIHPLN